MLTVHDNITRTRTCVLLTKQHVAATMLPMHLLYQFTSFIHSHKHVLVCYCSSCCSKKLATCCSCVNAMLHNILMCYNCILMTDKTRPIVVYFAQQKFSSNESLARVSSFESLIKYFLNNRKGRKILRFIALKSKQFTKLFK